MLPVAHTRRSRSWGTGTSVVPTPGPISNACVAATRITLGGKLEVDMGGRPSKSLLHVGLLVFEQRRRLRLVGHVFPYEILP